MFKIDCHTHILTPAIRDAYFSRTDGLALVMQLPDAILPCPDVVQTVGTAAAPVIVLDAGTANQLKRILKRESGRIGRPLTENNDTGSGVGMGKETSKERYIGK